MKGIVDVTENIKTKINGTQRSMWRFHGPPPKLTKELTHFKIIFTDKNKTHETSGLYFRYKR
ncbi:MAG: hypothetical protein ACXWFC_02735 [Nitrososphaeraceae archaeon]